MIINKKEKIYGWARYDYSLSYYNEVENLEKINEIFDYAIKKNISVSLRSGGRSYGDNTLNNNNIILKHSNYEKILNFDHQNGIIAVQSGITFDKIIQYIVPKGWIFHVCPAHRYITISGALSNNVHGKNCFLKGFFGEYVEEFTFFSYHKGIIKCSRSENSKYFYSIISGLGILGLILDVKIRLRKINSFYLNNETNKFKNINGILEYMESSKKEKEFNIASFDATKFSNKEMSGIVYSSDFLDDGNLTISDYNPSKVANLINLIFIYSKKIPFVNSLANIAFSLKTRGVFLKKKQSTISYAQMNFLIDIILPRYNFFFKKGFVEYQVMFRSEYCKKAFVNLMNVLKRHNSSSLTSSVKAYRKNKEPFVFGLQQNGFCLSFSIPHEKHVNMNKLMRELNETTIKYEGQLYLAKTPYVNYEEFKIMYKNIDNFLEIKKELDPKNLIKSNMSERLKLN